MSKLSLPNIQALAAVGGYAGDFALTEETAATILSVAVFLSNTRNWHGAGFELTEGEINDIGYLVGQLLYDCQNEIENGGATMYPFDARLTLAAATPIVTTNQLAKTVLYLTPYNGRALALWNGVDEWITHQLTQRFITNSGLSNDKNHDAFVYPDSVPEIELVAWSTDHARATALNRVDGVLVKTGATTHRYAGTIRTDGDGKFMLRFDNNGGTTPARLFVQNHYNRVPHFFNIWEDTNSWTYDTATWRPWNDNEDNRVEWVHGNLDYIVDVTSKSWLTCYAEQASFGLRYNAISGTPEVVALQAAGQSSEVIARYTFSPTALGLGYMQLMEWSDGADAYYAGDWDQPTIVKPLTSGVIWM